MKKNKNNVKLSATKSLKPIASSEDGVASMPISHPSLPHLEKKILEGVLEQYVLDSEGAKVSVKIEKKNNDIAYMLDIPVFDVPTMALMRDVRNELVSLTSVSMKELVDQESFYKIKDRFALDAKSLLKKKLPNLNDSTEKLLICSLIQDMLGLGKIEFLIADPNLEEIVIPSSKENVRVFYKRYGWLVTNILIDKEEEILNFANIIARRVGKQVSILSPLLDAHLVSGDRINAVLYPVNTKGNTITIRKFSRDPYTMVDLIKNKTCSLDAVALLWIAMEYEMNIIISGGTGSGKTSFLNACLPFIQPNQRVLTMEDTRELVLPEFLYWTPLVTRTPNAEDKGGVSMLDLLVNSLRMRPDRIILGEMRRKEEAMVLFEAMHTGHAVYSTVHADTAPDTISRLTNAPISIPHNLLKAVDLNVVMFRDRRRGGRRVLQIAEFDVGKEDTKANILFRLSSEKDALVKHSPSLSFFESLTRNTGMSDKEIEENLAQKKKIFNWLINNNVRSLPEIGKIMNIYYKDKEFLIKKINENDKKALLG